MIRERFKEAGPALTAFVVYQALALGANLLMAGVFGILTVVIGAAAVESPEIAEAGVGTLENALIGAINAAALIYGLRLIFRRHAATRWFWTGYLAFSLLLYGYYLLIGGPGCFTIGPLLANLGWLIYWSYSQRVQQLFP